MNNYIDSEIILQRRTSPFIYVYIMIILIVSLSLIIISILFDYEAYLDVKGVVVEDNNHFYIDIYINIDDIKFVTENNVLKINDSKYEYSTIKIDENIINDGRDNYHVVRIDTNLKDEYKYNNLVIMIKILKCKKKIINYFI